MVMVNDLPIYKITIDPEYSDGEDLGIEQIAFTSNPAIKVKGMAFSNVTKRFFSDELKYRVTAPAMIPMEIYRRDDEAGEYYVQFEEETIEQIYVKFMRDLQNRNVFNLEHDPSKEVPAYILEAWIVENPTQDKAFTTYGIEVPKGTLMLTAQITDADYYNKLVKDEQLGFSIEGFLGMKLSNQLTKYNMNFPDGEHLIEGKIYVVKDGQVVEIKEVEKEEVEMAEVTEEVTEEVAMEDTSVTEEEVVEEEVATEMAIDPVADSEAILAIVMPLIEEREKAIIGMVADLKNQIEELGVVKEEVEDEMELAKETKMSAFDRFKAFRASNK
jgi:Putative phage serine protease XkdF